MRHSSAPLKRAGISRIGKLTQAASGLAMSKTHGAEVLLADQASGAPVLLENALGKGKAYFLNTWAFPGNVSLEPLCRDILTWLSIQRRGDVFVEDFSNEIAWSVWRDETFTEVCLLNTDWTEQDNEKPCRICFGDYTVPVTVRERRFATVAYDGNIAFLSGPGQPRLESRESGGDHEAAYKLRAWGPSEIPLLFTERRSAKHKIERY